MAQITFNPVDAPDLSRYINAGTLANKNLQSAGHSISDTLNKVISDNKTNKTNKAIASLKGSSLDTIEDDYANVISEGGTGLDLGILNNAFDNQVGNLQRNQAFDNTSEDRLINITRNEIKDTQQATLFNNAIEDRKNAPAALASQRRYTSELAARLAAAKVVEQDKRLAGAANVASINAEAKVRVANTKKSRGGTRGKTSGSVPEVSNALFNFFTGDADASKAVDVFYQSQGVSTDDLTKINALATPNGTFNIDLKQGLASEYINQKNAFESATGKTFSFTMFDAPNPRTPEGRRRLEILKDTGNNLNKGRTGQRNLTSSVDSLSNTNFGNAL